jgi:hypothetical protein
MSGSFEFDAVLWLYPGNAGWVFLTLPTETADEILDTTPVTGGFGSVRVDVGIGTTEWSTSVFPDKQSGSFVLPVKRAVRASESIEIGDTVRVRLSLIARR